MPLTANKRQAIVDHLTGNCECGAEPMFTEDQAGFLEDMDDSQLLRLTELTSNARAEDDEDDDDEEDDEEDFEDDEEEEDDDEEDEGTSNASCKCGNSTPVKNKKDMKTLNEYSDDELAAEMMKRKGKGKKKMSANSHASSQEELATAGNRNGSQDEPLDVDSYLDTLPAPVRAFVQNSLDDSAAQREELIGTINASGTEFTQEELEGLSTPSLKKMASALAAPKATSNQSGQRRVNYQGRGGAGTKNSRHVEAPLVAPRMSFAEASE